MPPRTQPHCRFCPQPAAAPTPSPAQPPTVTLAITSPGEGERLWKHVLFGTSTCITMIEGYAALDMPGNPKEALVALRDRIQKVLSKYGEPHAQDESRSPTEPASSDDQDQSAALQG